MNCSVTVCLCVSNSTQWGHPNLLIEIHEYAQSLFSGQPPKDTHGRMVIGKRCVFDYPLVKLRRVD